MPIAFGKYALQRKLAEGGMAEVFLARQGGPDSIGGFEKLVVIKRILPALSKEESFLKMFLNEARVAARLNHPNIVQIWDLGRIEELYFIAMEYVHGEDLREMFQRADQKHVHPSQGLICRVLADTLAGLHYAHTRVSPEGKPLGLVHRDVSPQNVIVTYEGSIKLVDFGIAKATRATSEQTQAGLFKGKFAYMSPEQSRGQPVDARSDVFSVGILLWELLTWRRLFKRPTEMATLIAVAEDEIPSPRSIDPSVPEPLEKIVMRALRRPLDERYASAQDMRADLETLIRDMRWEADALHLARFMRDLFVDKLQAQDNDIKAAGLASLEDFLLRVEDQTNISWMEQRQSSVKTPSVGLSSVSSLYDDDPTEKPTEMMKQQPSVMVEQPESSSAPTLIAKDASKPTSLPTTSLRAHAPPPPVPPPVIDRGFGSEGSTAKRTSYDPQPPSRAKRLVVIASAATLVAGIGLTAVLWPQKEPAPIAVPVGVPDPLRPIEPPASPRKATLLITVDAPSVIAVDGAAQPLGESATVEVEPGVTHVVTAQRPGHSVHTLHLPIVMAGERLPVASKLK